MNDHVAGDEEPIRGLQVVVCMRVHPVRLIGKSEKSRGINEDRCSERRGGRFQGFSCR